MRERGLWRVCFLVLVVLESRGGLWGRQELPGGGTVVTYVSGSTVYIGAGRSAGLAEGDTVLLSRGTLRLPLTAVSSSSGAIQYAARPGEVTVGDSVHWTAVRRQRRKAGGLPGETRGAPDLSGRAGNEPGGGAGRAGMAPMDQALTASANAGPAASGPTVKGAGTMVRGRLALQYVGAGTLGSRMQFSQPSLLLQLGLDRLFGTGLRLSVYGRAYRDMSPGFSRYGEGSRTKYRLFDLTLAYEGSSWFGVEAGRIISRFAGGLGQLDGGQVSVKAGRWTAGVLVGAQPDYRSSGVDFSQQKGALFVAYGWDGQSGRSEVTMAYGRQLHEGRLDRDFVYVQGRTQLGPVFSLYESSEIDLHTIDHGVRTHAFRLTNTFVTLSFAPVDWATVSGGFDATRSIYLFDSMKSVADSLIDQELRQGFRGGLTFHMPGGVSASFNGTYRLKTQERRDSRSLGGALRAYNLLGSRIGAGLSYMRVQGAYTGGNDMAVDADVQVLPSVSLTARLDRYTYDLVSHQERFRTTTLTGMLSIRLSSSWYSLLSVDQVWDAARPTQRVFGEIGVRF